MGLFMKVLASERLKLSKSFIWLLVPISPLIALLTGLLVNLEEAPLVEHFAILLTAMGLMHAMLILPIMTGILSAFVCRYEHGGGGWKQLLALPISRSSLYIAKFTIVALLLGITQLLFLIAVIVVTAYHGIDGGVPWDILLSSVIGGWIACLPLAALQLWASIGWSSFAAPLAVNVMMTLPNMLIVNSATYGPFYPWAQPMLAMLSSGNMDFGGFALPLENLLITVLGSFVIVFIGGLIYFNRREI
ncbi:MAG: ABC transporter permease [Candidatus Pristimantibacillus sp.]